MKKINVCLGITFYNPTSEDVLNVIDYSKYFSKIYIYNNSENNVNFRKISTLNNICMLSTGKNDGLSIACHTMCYNAKQENFDYIIIFDQDSRMEIVDIKKMIQLAEVDDIPCEIYCPKIIYQNEELEEENIFLDESEFVKWCITSGSMINLNKYGTEYIFDTNYFIDAVDKDFCRQVINNKGRIKRLNHVRLFQKLGNLSKKGNLVHSSLRHYYISRNRLYFNKKFKENKLKSFLQIIKHLFIIIRYEDFKLEKIKMIFKGIIDYKKNIVGKI